MLKQLFVSEVRVNLIKLLLLNSQKSFHVRGMVRLLKAEINAVRRELDNLLVMGLLTRRQSSNKIFYQANTLHPFFSELMSLCAKEVGLGHDIITHAKKLGDLEFVVLSLPYIRGRKSTALDVDLFLVGSPNLSTLDILIKQEETKNNREINYSVMTSEEFKMRKRTNDQFINRLMSQGRCILIGDDDKFSSII